MENYIDYKIVRSVVLAIAICTGSLYTLFLSYLLFQDFFDIFSMALVTSLAIKPCKDWVHSYFLIVYETSESYPITKKSLSLNAYAIVQWLLKINFIIQIGTVLSISLLLVKFPVSLLLLITLGVLIIDFLLRIIGDILLKISKLLKLYDYKTFFDAILTIFLLAIIIISAIIFLTLALGSMVLEISEHGKSFFGWVFELFDEEGLESLKSNSYIQLIDKNIEEILGSLAKEIFIESEQCSVFIESTMDLPVLNNLLFDTLVQIDELLVHLRISSHQILNFYFLNPGNFHEILWKTFSLGIRLFFGNMHGVAIAISTKLERVILYFTLVYILVKDKTTFIEKMLNMVPLENKIKYEILSDILSTISGITTSFLLGALVHYVATLGLYFALGLDLKYTFSVLSAVVGLFPFFGSWFVNLPMTFWLLFRWDFRAIIVFTFEYFVVGYLDSFILTAQLGTYNPTLIGIVIVLGIYKFGIFGIFYGPVIMLFGYLVFKLGKGLNPQSIH
jgi:predicted PurR-regulated permease PerM